MTTPLACALPLVLVLNHSQPGADAIHGSFRRLLDHPPSLLAPAPTRTAEADPLHAAMVLPLLRTDAHLRLAWASPTHAPSGVRP